MRETEFRKLKITKTQMLARLSFIKEEKQKLIIV